MQGWGLGWKYNMLWSRFEQSKSPSLNLLDIFKTWQPQLLVWSANGNCYEYWLKLQCQQSHYALESQSPLKSTMPPMTWSSENCPASPPSIHGEDRNLGVWWSLATACSTSLSSSRWPSMAALRYTVLWGPTCYEMWVKVYNLGGKLPASSPSGQFHG